MQSAVVGLFDEFRDAEAAMRELERAGFTRDELSLVANQPPASETLAADAARAEAANDSMVADAAAGATGGALVGGIGGLIVGLAAFTIPGIGPVLAAGPLIMALTGAGLGAAAGGLIGALTNAGIPYSEAEYYVEGVRRGGALLTVHSPDSDRAALAASVMRANGVVDIHERAAAWRRTGWTGYDPNAGAVTAEQIQRDREERRLAAAAHGQPASRAVGDASRDSAPTTRSETFYGSPGPSAGAAPPVSEAGAPPFPTELPND